MEKEKENTEGNFPEDSEGSPQEKPEENNEDLALKTDDLNMMEAYEETFRNIVEGEIVKGEIVQITEGEVVVDVGYKSEGAISINEFRTMLERGNLKVGDKIDVFLERTEDSDGQISISKEKADKVKIWDDLTESYESGKEIDGKVIEKTKGGLIVDIGVRAFLPGSQIDLRPVKDMDSLIGQMFTVRVIKLNKERGNIVLSRRIILEKEREDKKKQTLEKIKEGALVEGIVKNITDYGAFIDLGGIDGLLHITDMSWGRINHPSELFSVGDRITVVVIKYDKENEKVSLGYKQKTFDPWEAVEEKYSIGTKVKGRVISITDYGAFVELEKGVEGLIHISEMSWTKKIRHPSKILTVDTEIEAIVLDLDKERKRISLGLKQTELNPWYVLKDKYPISSNITGKVRNITNFGAFIEVEDGIDGLVHISDMSWTQRINHPSEILKKGDRIDAVVLDLDPDNEKLSLGIKQLSEDPWSAIPGKFPVGRDTNGRIVKITEFGAFVELEKDVEGLIHLSEFSKERIEKPGDIVAIGDTVNVRIIKIDTDERKIGLSMRAFQEAQDRLDIDSYNQNQVEAGSAQIGDMIKDKEALKKKIEENS